MKRMKWAKRAATVAVAAILAVVGITALAAEGGSADDPLVTLSYLKEKLTPSILTQVDEKIAAEREEIQAQLKQNQSGGETTYVEVTLRAGQQIKGGVGTELLLRSGSATCVATSSPGLVDVTSGGSLNNGAALEKNHLYMMTTEGRGAKAADAVTLLVRGEYTIS